MLGSANRELLQTQVSDIEVDLFRECFTLEFREQLITASTDVYGIPEYSETATYALGDKVYFRFKVYESLANANTAQLADVSKWKEPLFFGDNEKENKLWYGGMSRWIAYSVYKAAAPYIAYPASGKGIMTHFEDSGERTVDPKQFYTLVRSIDNNISIAKRNMLFYYNTLFLSADSNCNTKDDDGYEANDRIAFD